MKAYSERHDNQKFRKQLKRDFIVLMVISMACAIGIVLTAFYGAKYGW